MYSLNTWYESLNGFRAMFQTKVYGAPSLKWSSVLLRELLEEDIFISMLNGGSFIEAIEEEVDKLDSVEDVRLSKEAKDPI